MTAKGGTRAVEPLRIVGKLIEIGTREEADGIGGRFAQRLHQPDSDENRHIGQ